MTEQISVKYFCETILIYYRSQPELLHTHACALLEKAFDVSIRTDTVITT